MPNRYVNVDSGEAITAFQVDYSNLDESMSMRTYTNSDGVEVERAFLATKDPDGRDDMDDNHVDVDEGVWVLAHEDGTVTLMADVDGFGNPVFAAQWNEAK